MACISFKLPSSPLCPEKIGDFSGNPRFNVVTSPPDPLSFPRRGGRYFLREAPPLFYSPILLINLLERRTWAGDKKPLSGFPVLPVPLFKGRVLER